MTQGIKGKWLPYIGIRYDFHKLFAEQPEAVTLDRLEEMTGRMPKN